MRPFIWRNRNMRKILQKWFVRRTLWHNESPWGFRDMAAIAMWATTPEHAGAALLMLKNAMAANKLGWDNPYVKITPIPRHAFKSVYGYIATIKLFDKGDMNFVAERFMAMKFMEQTYHAAAKTANTANVSQTETFYTVEYRSFCPDGAMEGQSVHITGVVDPNGMLPVRRPNLVSGGLRILGDSYREANYLQHHMVPYGMKWNGVLGVCDGVISHKEIVLAIVLGTGFLAVVSWILLAIASAS
jgi:hypothetical protein